eukprot:m.508547 g.508547  ORF g.508547 m.508547 type:complete len:597 (-) comp21882_c0_seq10:460-2250(-)
MDRDYDNSSQLRVEVAQKRACLASKFSSESKFELAKLRVQQAQLRAEYNYLQECLDGIEPGNSPHGTNEYSLRGKVHTSIRIADAVKKVLVERVQQKSKSKRASLHRQVLHTQDVSTTHEEAAATQTKTIKTKNVSAIPLAKNVTFQESSELRSTKKSDSSLQPTPASNQANGVLISHVPSESMGNISFMSSKTYTSEQNDPKQIIVNSKPSGESLRTLARNDIAQRKNEDGRTPRQIADDLDEFDKKKKQEDDTSARALAEAEAQRLEKIREAKRVELAKQTVTLQEQRVKDAAKNDELDHWHGGGIGSKRTTPTASPTLGETYNDPIRMKIEEAERQAIAETQAGSAAHNDDAILRAIQRSNPDEYRELSQQHSTMKRLAKGDTERDKQRKEILKEQERLGVHTMSTSPTRRQPAGNALWLSDADYLLSMLQSGVDERTERRDARNRRYHVNQEGCNVFRESDIDYDNAGTATEDDSDADTEYGFSPSPKRPGSGVSTSGGSTSGTAEQRLSAEERRQMNVREVERRKEEVQRRKQAAWVRSLERRKRSEIIAAAADAEGEASQYAQLGRSQAGAAAAANKSYFMRMRASQHGK